jgi:hypothetical protein
MAVLSLFKLRCLAVVVATLFVASSNDAVVPAAQCAACELHEGAHAVHGDARMLSATMAQCGAQVTHCQAQGWRRQASIHAEYCCIDVACWAARSCGGRKLAI